MLCQLYHCIVLLCLLAKLPHSNTQQAFTTPPNTQLSQEAAVTEFDTSPVTTDASNGDSANNFGDNSSSSNYTGNNSNISSNGNYTGNNNTRNNTLEECEMDENPIGNLIMVLYSLVCIVGLLGNTLVIYVVLRFSKMQTVTNIYILNLAIADECFLIGIPFLVHTMHSGGWKFGEYMCRAYLVSGSITQFTSSIFLLIMSADRYIAVCHPISSPRYRTPFSAKIVSGIAWLASAVLMLPVILFASSMAIVVPGDEQVHVSCLIKWPEGNNNQSDTTFILYTLVLGFATPLCFILCFYYLVIRKLQTVGPKHKSKEKKRSHRKVTKLVLTVITVYIMCWLPYWIMQVTLISMSPGECVSRLEITLFLLVSALGYSNSAMNPILYAFLSDNFKKSFMKACTCATRNDVNAQLQLENSIFPKWAGGGGGGAGNAAKQRKQQARLLCAKQKQKHLLARNNNATTTTTTATTCADALSSVYPELAAPVLQPPNAALLVVTTTTSMESNNDQKPPVLHTDL